MLRHCLWRFLGRLQFIIIVFAAVTLTDGSGLRRLVGNTTIAVRQDGYAAAVLTDGSGPRLLLEHDNRVHRLLL